MPVVVCPNPSCGTKLTLADDAATPTTKCPVCRTLLSLSKKSGTAPAAALPTARSADDAAARSGGLSVERVGRFVIVGKLGAGAFGTVFRARDPHLDREVALKVPNAGVLGDPRRVERFLREAKAAARLRHPHIVPVFDAGRDGDQYFIASAFVDGTPMSDAVGDRGMDIRRAAEVVRLLAGAVGYAHEQGVVHRDIKPSNVMLDAADRPHLMDFGLASRADEAEKLTSDGAVMGTPAYMSPEQAGGQRGDPTPAWDQYALGVVLYELLTGRTPFSGPPAAVIFQVLNSDPPTPRSVRPHVPADLETICLKAMARDPGDRYVGCAAMAEDLRRWLAGEPITARKRGPAERAARWVRENDTVAAPMAVTFAAMALGTILAVTFAQNARWQSAKAKQALGERESLVQRAEAAELLAGQQADETKRISQQLYDEKFNAQAARERWTIEKESLKGQLGKSKLSLQKSENRFATSTKEIEELEMLSRVNVDDMEGTWQIRNGEDMDKKLKYYDNKIYSIEKVDDKGDISILEKGRYQIDRVVLTHVPSNGSRHRYHLIGRNQRNEIVLINDEFMIVLLSR